MHFEQKTISEQIDLILAHCAFGASGLLNFPYFHLYDVFFLRVLNLNNFFASVEHFKILEKKVLLLAFKDSQ